LERRGERIIGPHVRESGKGIKALQKVCPRKEKQKANKTPKKKLRKKMIPRKHKKQREQEPPP